MKRVSFSNAQFITSATHPDHYPSLHFPEIAFVGRSNVGKSSLINHLCRHKKLAKVSATPGKTQLINFFNVDGTLCLVDLPGYGYAKVPPKEKEKWAESIGLYFSERENLSLLLLLVDIRRDPNDDDLALIKWASQWNKPILLICTKTDKLKPRETQNRIAQIKKSLGIDLAIPYSIKEKSSRGILVETINKLLGNK